MDAIESGVEHVELRKIQRRRRKAASGLTGCERRGGGDFLAPYYQVNRCGAGSSNRAGFLLLPFACPDHFLLILVKFPFIGKKKR